MIPRAPHLQFDPEAQTLPPPANPRHDAVTWAQWAELLTRLGEPERRVLKFFAERLLQGQEVYGPLEPRGRDWLEERDMEGIDWLVYQMVALLAERMMREGSK